MASLIPSGSASGTGSMTLAAPVTNSNQTITLPDSTGTVITTGSPQSGGVIQVVQTTGTSSNTTTSSSYVTTGIAATITPKFSTSKILVLVNVQGYNGTTLVTNRIAIYRGGSSIAETQVIYSTSAGGGGGNASLNILDTPATTSSTTYTIYYKTSGGTFYINADGSATDSITLMEIAA